MLKNRIIPCLLLRGGGLVKTRRFAEPRYVGDPINAVRIFNEKEVDELLVLDISASKEQAEPNYALIEQLAGECFMPLAYGGGVKSVDQARQLFSLGVEKVCIQSAALDSPEIVAGLAEQFGAQSVIVSVDVKRDWLGRVRLYNASKGAAVSGDWLQFMQTAVSSGAGEILLNVVNRDGTMSGMDLDLIRHGAAAISAPLIAVGGAASLHDFKSAIAAGASAVSAGAFFVFHGPHRAVLITYPSRAELSAVFT